MMKNKNLTNEFPIIADPVAKTVVIGAYVIDQPIFGMWLNSEIGCEVKIKVIKANKISGEIPNDYLQGYKELHAFIGKHIGTRFNYRLKKALYSVWIGSHQHKELINSNCMAGPTHRNLLIGRFNRFLPIIKRAVLDGQSNLIPAILFFGCGPAKLKQIHGKSLWKKICRNSQTRNKLIYNRMYLTTSLDIDNYTHTKQRVSMTESMLETLTLLNALPSTLLKGDRYLPEHMRPDALRCALWVTGTKHCVLKDIDTYHQRKGLFNDARKMAKRLDLKFSETWSLRTMQQKHDSYTRIIASQSRSPKPFEVFETHPVQRTISEEHLTATLLDSELSLAIEGLEMGHCTAGYDYEVAKGLSVIFSLFNLTTKERATIEIQRDFSEVHVVQHQGQFTHVVSDELLEFGQRLKQYLIPLPNTKTA